MKNRLLALLVVAFLLILPLTGCNRSAVENVEDLNAQMEQAAAENGGADASTVEPSAGAAEAMATEVVETPPAAEPPSAEPTEAPTEVPTEAPPGEQQPPATEEPTPVPTEEPAAVEPTPQPPSEGGEQVHTVQPGENLFRIALRYGTTVEAIAQANGITNPTLIYVGQKLIIPSGGSSTPASGQQPPSSGGEIVHTVQPGENLFRIALKYNMSYLYLAQYNGITNPNFVVAGQQIRIPVQP